MTPRPEYVSDQLVDVLRAAGCRYLPLVPGSSFRGLHDSLVNYGGQRPQPILCTSETVAIAAAHAYAKATGQVGYAAVHDLVGLMQATMGVYNAWCDRTPLVLLGGGGPADPAKRRPIDWVHSASVQSELVRDFVKWADDPGTAQSTVDAIALGHRIAMSRPQGPVYVTMDAALQEQPAADVTVPASDAFAGDPAPVARQEDADEAVRLLVAARSPVVVAGRVGLDRAATPLLIRLAEMLGAGLMDERNFSSVPTRHALNVTGEPRALADADVVLAVEVHDRNLLYGQIGHGRDCAVIDMSDDALALRPWSHAGGGGGRPAVRLPAPGLHGLRQLADAVAQLAGGRPADRRPAWREAHEARAAIQPTPPGPSPAGQGITPAGLVADLYAVVRDEPWLLTLRNTRSWPEGVWEFEHGGQFLGHSGGGGIGYGPGALLGGGLAARDRGQLAVGIIGDGDLMYGPGVFWSARHYGVPMLTVVNNNRSNLNDEEHQRAVARARGRPTANAHVAIRFERPAVDFAAMARAHGAVGIGPVTAHQDLQEAFAEGRKRVKEGDVVVVDVHTV